MRSKAKPAPNPPGKEPGGAPGKETAAPLEQKSRPGDAKAGKEEDVHTCCGCRFPLLVALLQLVLGVSITVLAFLMAEFSPSLLLRETPYWAGALVSIPGSGLNPRRRPAPEPSACATPPGLVGGWCGGG